MGNWKTLSSKIVYENPRFRIREDRVTRPNGDEGTFFVMDRPPVVVIVPISANKEIYLIRINRYTTGQAHWELPAGSSDKQDELVAARRELKEETGLVSKEWSSLGTIEIAPGMTGQLAYVFVAQGTTITDQNDQDEENIDRMQKFSFGKVLDMIEKGEIVNGPSISAIMKAGLNLKLFK